MLSVIYVADGRRRTIRGSRVIAPFAARRIMSNMADGMLLDVNEVNFIDLDLADADSALDLALQRILSSSGECNFNSFNSSI
jgi:hypothetical protein